MIRKQDIIEMLEQLPDHAGIVIADADSDGENNEFSVTDIKIGTGELGARLIICAELPEPCEFE